MTVGAGQFLQLALRRSSPATAGSDCGFRALELLRLSADCVRSTEIRTRMRLLGRAGESAASAASPWPFSRTPVGVVESRLRPSCRSLRPAVLPAARLIRCRPHPPMHIRSFSHGENYTGPEDSLVRVPAMRMVAALLLLVSLLPAVEIKVGHPAPQLTLDRILQAPPGAVAEWQQLRDKAVVLEFWATWCPGCREKIPHRNRLSERFAARPVQFLSITDEDIDIVTRFLKDQPIAGWVALDSDGTTFERYGITGRPLTVLVDAGGIVRAVTRVDPVTDSTVEALLAGEPLGLPDWSESRDPGMGQVRADTLFEVSIRTAGSVAVTGYSPGAIVSRGGRFEGYGLTLRRLLAMAYGLPEERVVAPSWCDESRYDLVVASPLLISDNPTERRRLIRQVLTETFRVEVIREPRPTKVYVLQKTSEWMPELEPSEFSSRLLNGNRGNFKVTGGEWRDLARLLKRELDRPVLDETGLQGRYDFEFHWDIWNPISVLDFVRDQLGLELRLQVREIEHLIVQSIERAMTW